MNLLVDELNKFESGHLLECFHNLDIPVINAEIGVLHHSALLFFERTEISETLLTLLFDFAIQKEVGACKVGKLASSSNQKNAIYNKKEFCVNISYCRPEN